MRLIKKGQDAEPVQRSFSAIKVQGHALRRDLDLTKLENQRIFAKNIFVFGQCMEGTQFYGLFGMILALERQNKFTGIGNMFRYTLRDECLLAVTPRSRSPGSRPPATSGGGGRARYDCCCR